jgi:hypothetical protein
LREASQSYVDELAEADSPAVDLVTLRPYRSATVLQFDPQELHLAMQATRRFLRGLPAGRETQYVVVGVGWDDSEGSAFDELLDFDDIDLIVHRNTSSPAWSTKDAPYSDVSHLLNIALFRRGLIAIHLAEPWKSAIQRWLDQSPRPPLRRVSTSVLEHSFLRGEAKGLWLRGTHSRRSSRPDAKNLTGLSLANALDPIEDSSFAMGSGRAEFSDPTNSVLKGAIGTTPRKSTVWSGRAGSFAEYLRFCRGLLDEVERTITLGLHADAIFPELAEEVSSLHGVHGAYEVLFEWPDGPPGDIEDAELAEILDFLEKTDIEVVGRPESAHFKANVTFPEADGVFEAEVEVRSVDSGFDLDCSVDRPGRKRSTGLLRDLFKDTDVARVYFESGHTITNGRLYRYQVRPARFKNWKFEDFTGFDVSLEKPPMRGAEMYRKIGTSGDVSLFSWVVRKFATGYLTCDDGAGEVADFVHVSERLDQLTLVHVKAAQSDSNLRCVSAQAYEVVVSQAAKNLVFLNPETLKMRLSQRTGFGRPSWTNGTRVSDRSEFMAALSNLKATAETAVQVVQPHMQEQVYNRCRDDSNHSADSLRLRLLETLLNNLRSSAVSYSSDVVVIGQAA